MTTTAALLTRLERERQQAVDSAETLSLVHAGKGPLNVTDGRRLESLLSQAELADARLRRLSPRAEPLTYERGNGRSFFGDLMLTTLGDSRGDEARARLDRHHREVAVEYERRAVIQRLAFDRELTARGWSAETRDLTRVDGSGGNFVPPMWLADLFAPLARPGRVLAALVRGIPLPAGTDSITIPRLTAGPATGVQTADNAAVQETDLADAGITCPVRTVAGHQDVPVQLLDQASPLVFDEVVASELLAAYNANLGAQLIAGSAASGQLAGVLGVGANPITYTDATPTVPELQVRVAEAASLAATGRNLPPTACLMHPRRWFWIASGLDSSNRPLVAPEGHAEEQDDEERSDRPVGRFASLPVYLDPSIPVTRGAGSNEDVVIVTRPRDSLLFESDSRLLTHVDPGSGTLTVRLSRRRYVAWTGARYPTGTSVVSGTGLMTPVFPWVRGLTDWHGGWAGFGYRLPTLLPTLRRRERRRRRHRHPRAEEHEQCLAQEQ